MATPDKQSRILMESDGFYREIITREFLGDQSTHLRQIATALPATAIHVAKLKPDDPFGVHLQIKAGHILAFTRISSLKLSTVFRFSADKIKVSPCWRALQPTDFHASYHWPVPRHMGLYFVMMLAPPAARRYDGDDGDALRAGGIIKFYLLAVAGSKVGAFWRLPLCNIYQDAAICMGDYHSDDPSHSILDRLKLALAHFAASPWNTDLDDQQSSEDQIALFTFTPKGESIPPPANWWAHAKKVNNTNYSELPLINLYEAGL